MKNRKEYELSAHQSHWAPAFAGVTIPKYLRRSFE
jgi:hypothetical protein